MTDAIAAAVIRKKALDAARAALRSGGRSEMEDALGRLPPDGQKASLLRAKLHAELSRDSAIEGHRFEDRLPVATLNSEGICYEFRFIPTGDLAFFSVDRVGACVRVTVNSNHPLGHIIAERGDREQLVVFPMLAAWAHYELDQSDDRRQRAVQDTRIDWGRLVRRLLSNDNGFRRE